MAQIDYADLGRLPRYSAVSHDDERDHPMLYYALVGVAKILLVVLLIGAVATFVAGGRNRI
jgi:hypothetical protein